MLSRRGALHFSARGEAARCALCHDALGARAATCDGCGVALHDDCRTATTTCPTLGCARGLTSAGVAKRERPWPGATTALACLALAAGALLAYVVVPQAVATAADGLLDSPAGVVMAAAAVTLVLTPPFLAVLGLLERIASGRRLR